MVTKFSFFIFLPEELNHRMRIKKLILGSTLHGLPVELSPKDIKSTLQYFDKFLAYLPYFCAFGGIVLEKVGPVKNMPHKT